MCVSVCLDLVLRTSLRANFRINFPTELLISIEIDAKSDELNDMYESMKDRNWAGVEVENKMPSLSIIFYWNNSYETNFIGSENMVMMQCCSWSGNGEFVINWHSVLFLQLSCILLDWFHR